MAGQRWLLWKALLAAGFRLILPFESRSQVVQRAVVGLASWARLAAPGGAVAPFGSRGATLAARGAAGNGAARTAGGATVAGAGADCYGGEGQGDEESAHTRGYRHHPGLALGLDTAFSSPGSPQRTRLSEPESTHDLF